MARPQVREVSAPSAIQGVASPVPTYVRPADPGRSSLHDLAEGLAAFDSGLGAFLNKRKGENDAAEAARANVDFHRNNQEGYAEAVRTGKIPAWASDTYVQSYKKAQGNLAGLRLRDRFSLAYQQWDGRHDADHEGYAAWAAQWVAQNVGDEQDPYVLAGLAPHLEALTLGGMDTFSTERDTRLKENARATTGALVTHSLEEAHDEWASTGEIDWDRHWSNILAEREAALARGDNGVAVDQLIVDSILLQAERTGSMEPLKLLERTLPGQSRPLSMDLKVREAVTKSQDRIKAAQGAMSADIARERERMEKQQQEELWADTLGLILKGEPVPEENIIELERRDGEARLKVARYQKEATEFGTQEDPEALLDIYTQIDQGAGVDFILRMREHGVIRDPATLTKALDRVKAVQNAHKDGGIFTSPTYKDTVKSITNATGIGDFSALTGERGLSSEGMEALYDYRQMLLDWETRNPNASLFEKEKAAREIGQSIVGRIVADPTGDYHGQYVSEKDAAELERRAAEEAAAPSIVQPTEEEAQNPFGGYSFIPNPIQSFREWWNGPQQPEESPQGGVEAPVAAPEPRVEQSPAPALESLSEARRSAVESLAARKGISVEDANQQLHDKLQEIMGEEEEVDPGIDGQTTGSISQESRDKLEALFQDPPRAEKLAASNVPAAPILSLIGKTEGTDRGEGYNETLGYGAYTGGKVNLVGMTLDEVDALQTKMLRHKDNKWNSSAVGRYQIVRTTLRSLRKELGLNGSERYDAKMQDRLGMALLERRGLSKWQAGRMSDDAFLDSLAKEWASLPNSQGKGHYKGQRAAATSAQVLKALYGGPPGHSSAALKPQGADLPEGTPAAYAKIPDVDGGGRSGQIAKFIEWNSDPVGNHEANLQSINPTLADVVRRAQQNSGVRFVIGSGKRDAALQKKAVEWGWSKTYDSDHLGGDAVDLWPLDEDGAVNFDSAAQAQIVEAMQAAAKELGVSLDVGANWKRFKDKPHFALKGRPSA